MGYCYDRQFKMIQEYAQIPDSAILRKLSRFILLSSSCCMEERSALSTWSQGLPVVGMLFIEKPTPGSWHQVPCLPGKSPNLKVTDPYSLSVTYCISICFPCSDMVLMECHPHRNSFIASWLCRLPRGIT